MGSPDSFSAAGTVIAGWPVVLNGGEGERVHRLLAAVRLPPRPPHRPRRCGEHGAQRRVELLPPVGHGRPEPVLPDQRAGEFQPGDLAPAPHPEPGDGVEVDGARLLAEFPGRGLDARYRGDTRRVEERLEAPGFEHACRIRLLDLVAEPFEYPGRVENGLPHLIRHLRRVVGRMGEDTDPPPPRITAGHRGRAARRKWRGATQVSGRATAHRVEHRRRVAHGPGDNGRDGGCPV